MAFVRLAFFPGGTHEQHEALAAELADAPTPPERRVFAAGPADGGWQVVQVWDDAGALADFNDRWFLPAFERVRAAGHAFPAPPTVVDLEPVDLVIR